MEEKRSLYDLIREAAKDGTLPRNFSLPDIPDSKIRFADGAMDGIGIYHMGAPEITDEIREGIKAAVDACSQRNVERAEELFLALSGKISAIRAIDELQAYIIENKDRLNAPDMYDCAAKLMVNSDQRECVKFGMSILELFSIEGNKPLANAVEMLGQCNEFTIFSVFIMSHWKDANERIFALARQVHGWGRIHAIERLEPDTDEIRRWLLREGVENDVVPAYSALTVWEKSGAKALLHSEDISDEDFSAIARVIDALLDEGPCAGISAVENHEQIIPEFLNKAGKRTLSIADYVIIRNIRGNFEEDAAVTELCRDILGSESCRAYVKDHLSEPEIFPLAEELGIEFGAEAMRLLETDFTGNFFLCKYLMSDEYRAKTIDLFRGNIPQDELKTASADDLIGRYFKAQNLLDCIVRELANYPLEGVDLAETALQCPRAGLRNNALSVFRSWVNIRKAPLETLLPETYSLISRLSETETDYTVSDNMRKLLDGEIDGK